MRHKNWVTSLKLEQWADSLSARALLPQVLRRLVHATLDGSSIERAEFPSGEGVQRPGIDGLTNVTASNAKVPIGIAAWESGCDANIKGKADSDFAKRTTNAQSAFIFVTPRKWTRKNDWSNAKSQLGSWREVRAYDSADLEEWLELAPAVDIWLSHELGLKPPGVCDLATHWKNLSATFQVPLVPSFVLTDRTKAVDELREWLSGPASALAVSAPSPSEVVDFIAAYTASLDQSDQSSIASRAVIVEEREAWRNLAGSSSRLLLIAAPQLELEPELISEAVRQNNHAIVFASRDKQHQGTAITLPRMLQSNLHDALRAAGLTHVEVERLSREAGGTFTILKRLLSQSPALTSPRWSRGDEAASLTPLILAGAWDDSNPADREILTRLSGRPYQDLLAFANRLRVDSDAPVMRVGTGWTCVSRADSWRLLVWALTSDLLTRFEAVATEVLSEANPALELPAEERYLASIRGDNLKYSHALREGLAETLGLMGVPEEASEIGDPCPLYVHAARVVRRLLDEADWFRWASLSSQLPDLAEAAPDEFLQAIESDLRRGEPELLKLFGQEGDGIFAGSPHTGLLWALEVLAWEPRFLSRSAVAFARLARGDPGGRLCNRPANSLRDIFLPWHPHTNAAVAERLTVLARILKQEPVAGWKLLLALLPKHHDSTSGTHKPKWQPWLGQWHEGVTRADYQDFVIGIAELLVANAAGNVERSVGLAEHLDELPEPALDRVLASFREMAAAGSEGPERTRVWNLLRAEASKHRRAQGLRWALPERIVQKLEATVATMAPADALDRNAWLFDSGVAFHVGSHGMKHDERAKLLFDLRLVAVREVWESWGFDGVLQLAKRASMPWDVGIVAEKAQLPLDTDSIPPLLIAEEVSAKQFARGFLGSCFDERQWDWLESLALRTWPVEQAAALLVIVPFQPRLWEFAASLGTEIEGAFWKQAYPHAARLTEEQTMFVVSKLRSHKRPFSVLDFVEGARDSGAKFSEDFLLSVLDGVLFAAEAPDEQPNDIQMVQYHITELLGYLQECPQVDESRIARLEWTCLKLLDGSGHAPVALHRQLARDPKLFVEIISQIYRAKSERGTPKEGRDVNVQHLAEKAYELLNTWHTIPGAGTDGTIDGGALAGWLKQARDECAALDRLEVADIHIGQLFSHAPADADGLWPCLEVRDTMEDINSEQIFRGFQTGIFNSRGSYSKSLTEGGAQERELARKHQQHADSLRAGWPLVAGVLQRVSNGYIADARREDEERNAR